jgi:PAS domain S-box-containing protein
LGRVKILVVDDHPENVLALQVTLDQPDYEVIGARSGMAALKEVLKHDFAVILLDVLMPDMDGFETARLIRQREASKHVPILFLTAAVGEVAMVHEGYSVGAVDYLVKPVDPNIVRAKVAVFVDLYRKGQRIREQEEKLRDAERQLSQEALRASEALYEATFERAPVGIAHADLAGGWLRMNQKFREIAGRDPAPLRNEALSQLLSKKVDEHREEKRYLSDGRTIWVSEVLSLVRAGNGEPKHFIVVIEDITERKASEERVRFLDAASRLLLSSFDHRNTLAQVARLAASSVARGCAIHVLGDDLFGEVLAVAHANPAEAAQLEARWRHAVEDPRLIVVPLVSRNKTLGRIGLLIDEAERPDRTMAEDLAHRAAIAIENARLYREAQDAIGARDEFLSIASHELRTPLTPLQILFQRLLGEVERVRTQAELRESLQRGERQVQRLTTLVDKLLDVSRIAGGQLQLQKERCDLVEITREVISRLGDELARAKCDVTVDAPHAVVGRWDELRVEQVITNLLSNAVKYGAGHPIVISVDGADHTARFSIRDRGMGIEPDHVGRIFGRFERAVSSRSYGGLGLGLYIARQLVEAHGGQISVESRPGEGALFVMQLPRD